MSWLSIPLIQLALAFLLGDISRLSYALVTHYRDDEDCDANQIQQHSGLFRQHRFRRHTDFHAATNSKCRCNGAPDSRFRFRSKRCTCCMDADGNSAQPTVKEPIDDATKENVYSIAKQLHHLMVLCSGVGGSDRQVFNPCCCMSKC